MKTTPSFIYWDKEEEFFVNMYMHKKGTICPYYVLDSKISKQYAAYSSIKLDLMDCESGINQLKMLAGNPHVSEIVLTSILFASIVKYAKCFTSGEGRGTSLNKKDVFKAERADMLDFHEKTMDLRNKYLAHAGNSGHETRAMILILSPDETEKQIETLIYAGFRLKNDDSNLNNYYRMIEYVLDHVNEKLNKVKNRMHREVELMDLERIYSNNKIPDEREFIPFDVKSNSTA